MFYITIITGYYLLKPVTNGNENVYPEKTFFVVVQIVVICVYCIRHQIYKFIGNIYEKVLWFGTFWFLQMIV